MASGQPLRTAIESAPMSTSSSRPARPPVATDPVEPGEGDVFESAAGLFRILSTPIRLRIISAVCQEEKNVSELLAQIETTQPNMSQHLSALHRSGVLSRRREGAQIYYKVQSERVAMLCRAVCTQIAIELDGDDDSPLADRLLPAAVPESIGGRRLAAVETTCAPAQARQVRRRRRTA